MWRSIVPRLRHVTSYHGRRTDVTVVGGSGTCHQRLPLRGLATQINKLSSQDDTQVQLPTEADVVVIGGGSLGCSTLYHLAKMGINAVLLEKDELTAGTTWHTAGLLWRLMPSDTAIQLIKHTRHLMLTLEEETGVSSGWISNGGMFIASNKQRLDEYKRMASLGRSFGVDSHVLGPAETKDVYPLMNVKDVYGVLYSPGDGTIDPASYCAALTRSAKSNGAKVFCQTAVRDVLTSVDDFGTSRVSAVLTDLGTIRTKAVANCAGAWAPQIGAMVGVKTPIVPMKHAYVITERMDGIQNMPNVRDHDASVYLRLQGDALCVGGYEPNPIFIEDLPQNFAFGLYELDWDVFSVHVAGAVNRVPLVEKTGIKSTVCGPESFTPDHKALMGEAPELRGFFLGAGFNSAGMMLGGGCGQQLAKWIINGRPDIDMFSYDIRRFSQKLTDDRAWIKARSHETYAKNYSILFPHDEPLSGRNMRRDALYQVLLAAGCVYQERHGWERPGWFRTNAKPAPALPYDYYGNYGTARNVEDEYRDVLKTEYTFDFPPHHDVLKQECLTCREKAALFNMSYFGKYYLIGPDAAKLADWLFTANVRKQPGATVYTCMVNKSGGTEADLTVSLVESGSGGPHDPKFDGLGYYLAVGGAAAQQNLSHIQTEMQDGKFNCRIIDHTDDMGLLSLQGPLSRQILQMVCPDVDWTDLGFPFSTHKVVSIAGHQCRAIRLSFVGEMGWELHVPNNSCVPVHKALMMTGKTLGLINSGYRAIDSLSIEKGYRHWHADLKADDTPLEAGLGFTCKLKTDIPFLGRDALEEQKRQGLKRRLVCFTIDDHVPLLGMESIFRDGQLVGYLARAEYAFALGKSLGYGYVSAPGGGVVTNELLQTGSYQIERMSVMHRATCHVTTPFDPKNKRLKGIYDEPLPVRLVANGDRHHV